MASRDSVECTKSELDLFLVPGTQTSVERGSWVDYYPIATLGSGPIEFVVPGTPDEYIDLAYTQLYVVASVTTPDGQAPADEKKVGPVNLFLHSLFSQVDVTLNDRVITRANNTYAYRAMLETLLSFSTETKRSRLTSSLYFKDTRGQLDETDPNSDNQGLKQRTRILKARDYEIELVGSIHSDIFQQDRLLLNNVDLKLRFIPSKPQFCLMSGDTAPAYLVNIKTAVVKIRKVRIAPSVILGQAVALRKATAKYPINRVDIKVISIGSGSLGETKDNLFHGQIPNKIIIGFVDHDAFNGSYSKNPYHFKHNNLSRLEVTIDGEPTPHKAIETNFEKHSRFIEAYYSLFTASGKLADSTGLDIERADYPRGYTLIALDLTSDLGNTGCCRSPLRKGNLRIDVKFAQALEESIYMLVYSEVDSMVEIDEARMVTIDSV